LHVNEEPVGVLYFTGSYLDKVVCMALV
jgi:hypothetical protein